MKNVLVTGTNGFLGSNFEKYVEQNKGWIVEIPNGHIHENLNVLGGISADISYIFHFADYGGTPAWCSGHSADVFSINVQMTLTLLKAWAAYWPDAHFIGFNSAWAWPASSDYLFIDDIKNGTPNTSVASYAAAKHALLDGMQAYKTQYGMKGTVISLGTVYGPGEHYDDRKIHFIPTIIKQMSDRVSNLIIKGNGNQRRNFTYVDDQMNIIDLLKDKNDYLISGVCSQHTVREVVTTLKEIYHFKGEIWYSSTSEPSRVLEIEPELSSYQSISLRKGLEKTVEWYEANRT